MMAAVNPISSALLCALLVSACAAAREPNFDESKVGNYTLPDPLTLQDGSPVRTPADWNQKRRPELLELFATQMFGRTPAAKIKVRYEVLSPDEPALGGLAVRRQVRVHFSEKNDGPKMDILLYVPAAARKPVPVFAGLNFNGNHTVHADPGIRLADEWVAGPEPKGVNREKRRQTRQTAAGANRGTDSEAWQVEKILRHGYALATAYYEDINPDWVDGTSAGVRPLFYKPGQSAPGPGEWGAIGAWAWGLSRIADYLETDKDIDAKRIALIGHSRLGKTALWAGAQDPRFAIVISNDSGEGGAALSKRLFGEEIVDLNTAFPHWFCGNYQQYSGHADKLPFDAHELIALVAPRPVYVASAEEDRWADPRGEFLSAAAAGRVYELLGKQGLGTDQMPGIHQPIMHTVGYHIRAGKHAVTAYDWDQYLAFADLQFGKPGR